MDDSYAIATPNNDFYGQLYAEFNPQGFPRVGAGDAANFLKKSNLPMPTLGQIWELSDSTKAGSLDKRGAFVAFKLVAAAQQGKPVANSSLYDSSLPPPKFGAPPPPANLQHHFQPSFPSPGRAPPIPPPPHISSSQSSPSHSNPNVFPPNWPIAPNDQVKYDSIFQSLNPINGKLAGGSVRPVLMNSGLDPVSLARIWELSDQDKDGHLDRIEMSIALHLVYRALQNESIPQHLPQSLIHPSKAMYAHNSSNVAPPHPPRPLFGSRAGSVTSLDDVHMGQSYSATIPRAHVPPQAPRAYSAQPNTNGSRVSGSSTPVSSQFPVSGSAHSLNASSHGGHDWPINTSDFAAQFAQCDTNSDGLVEGKDVRVPFLSTGLNPQVLANIWTLVDFKADGKLNLEQFSLIMFLIENAKRGEVVPIELPSNLIPPSFREPVPFSQNATTLPNNSVSTPQLPEATSMEIKEAIEGDNEEIKQLAETIQEMLLERKTAEENVVGLEADMNVKNSRIKNLQVELQTLESTVKQLERQKMEANRRLTDYDTQIEQLESACKAQREKKEETEKRMQQIDEDAKNAEESKLNDEKEMEELRNEIEQLENQFKNVKSEVVKESGSRERMVAELTSLERREGRDNAQMSRLSTAIDNAKQLTDQIVAAVEEEEDKMENTLRMNPSFMAAKLDESLLSDDTFYGEASTSNQQANHVQQPPDPFASAKSNPSADPFAQVDPFASQGSFAAAFPTDPFSQGFPVDPVFSSNANTSAAAPAKPAPPRPAPPKSARTTPVPDPFAPQGASAATTQVANANFANFADFGSAFN